MSRTTKCPDCHSIKVFPGINEGDGKCSQCYGQGYGGALDQFSASLVGEKSNCIVCKGSGVCQTCHGKGTVEFVEPEPREERSPSNSSSTQESGLGCILMLAGLFAVLFVAVIALVTSFIWLGAAAVAAIVAFFHAPVVAARINVDELDPPERTNRSRNRPPYFRYGAMLKRHYEFKTTLWIPFVSGLGYALLAGGILLLTNNDGFSVWVTAAAIGLAAFLSFTVPSRMYGWRLNDILLKAHNADSGKAGIIAGIWNGVAITVLTVFGLFVAGLAVSGSTRPPTPNASRSASSQGRDISNIPESKSALNTVTEAVSESPQARLRPREATTQRQNQTVKSDPSQQQAEFSKLLHDNVSAGLDAKSEEFIVELDWMARLGAARWVAPTSALAFEQTGVGQTVAGGAFRGSTIVRIPIRSGSRVLKQTWQPDPDVEAPWKKSMPPQSEEYVSDAIELHARGPREAAILRNALRGIAPGTLAADGRAISVKIEESPTPANQEEDRWLVLRRGADEIGRFPTIGYVLQSYLSPNQQLIAVNNRQGNSGDYLWVIATADGKVLKRPGDDLGMKIERRASALADEAAKRKSSLLEAHKTWINAIAWTGNNRLSVNVRTQHLSPNTGGLIQNVAVKLQVDAESLFIEEAALVAEAAAPAKQVEGFIRSKLDVEATHDLDRIAGHYADRVSYWDNGVVDREFIRKDKSDYFDRWPATREEIISPIEITQKGDEWIASFKTRFRVENSAKGVVIEGEQESSYSLSLFDNALKVVAENGRVLHKDKRETAPQTSLEVQDSTPTKAMTGEKFPETRSRQLSESDASKMTLDGIRYAINEMFARHGADFPKAEIKRQFQRFAWYRPRVGVAFDQIEADFSDVEKANVKLLGAARDAKSTEGSPAAKQPAQAQNFSGSWSGAVSPARSASGKNGSFAVALQIDPSGKAGAISVNNQSLASLSSTESDSAQLRLQGYHSFPDGRATITVIVSKKSSRMIAVSIRTDTANGGWSVMEGVLRK